MMRLRAGGILAAMVLSGPAGLAQLTIVPTFDSTITSDPNGAQIQATINQAIGFYNTNLTTASPVTVNIKFQTMSSGLGASSTFVGSFSYTNVRAALVSNATTANDALALANLPVQTNNPVNGNAQVILSTANARALGFTGSIANPPSGQPDCTVSINTSITNLQHGVITDPAKYDLFAVASHEINEGLGLGSALDQGGAQNNPVRMMDLFRYDQNGARSYTTNRNAEAYFSLDGTTRIVRFNQDQSGDHGDWHGIDGVKVQNAFGTPGVSIDNGPEEMAALDVIGYAPVPEPAAGLLLAGIGLVVGWYRHRRRTPSD
jgi:hypothetical protein